MELSIDPLNKNKTVYTSFSEQQPIRLTDFKGNQIIIPFANKEHYYRYLGIWVNLELNWIKQQTVA